jgi:hypothetical protein
VDNLGDVYKLESLAPNDAIDLNDKSRITKNCHEKNDFMNQMDLKNFMHKLWF